MPLLFLKLTVFSKTKLFSKTKHKLFTKKYLTEVLSQTFLRSLWYIRRRAAWRAHLILRRYKIHDDSFIFSLILLLIIEIPLKSLHFGFIHKIWIHLLVSCYTTHCYILKFILLQTSLIFTNIHRRFIPRSTRMRPRLFTAD